MRVPVNPPPHQDHDIPTIPPHPVRVSVNPRNAVLLPKISARKNEDGNSPNPPLPPPSGDTPRITTNSGPGASAGPVNDKPAGNGGAGSGNVLRGTGSGDHSQSGMFASSETGLSVGANDIDCSDVLGTAESGVDGDSGARGWSSKSLAEGAKVAVEMAVAGSRLEDRNKGSVNMAHAEVRGNEGYRLCNSRRL